MKVLVMLMMIFLLNYNLSDVMANDSDYIEYKVHGIFRENNLDIDTKGTRGWIRLFSNREKLHDYNLELNDDDIKLIQIYFKDKLMETEQYNRRIQ